MTETTVDTLAIEALQEREVVTVHSVFGALKPYDVLKQAWAMAQPLARMIESQHLSVKIGARRFVKVEGWTACGAMTGVFPIIVWSRRLKDEIDPDGVVVARAGWEACCEARTLSGALVGRAEAQCTRSEPTWSSRDDYALRAMAQTRATSRALRGPLGFVVALGGYEATAAEEMPRDEK